MQQPGLGRLVSLFEGRARFAHRPFSARTLVLSFQVDRGKKAQCRRKHWHHADHDVGAASARIGRRVFMHARQNQARQHRRAARDRPGGVDTLHPHVVHHPGQGVEVRSNAQKFGQLARHILVHGVAVDLAEKPANFLLQVLHRLQLACQARIGLGLRRRPWQGQRVLAHSFGGQLHGQVPQARHFAAQRLQC